MKVYNEQTDKNLTEQLKKVLAKIRTKRSFNATEYIEKKSDLLNEYMGMYGLSACVVAISGGIDSATVLSIIKRASEKEKSPIKKIIPMLLPIMKSTGVTNQNEATNRGEELCDFLGLKPYVIDLSSINNEIRDCVEPVIGINGEDWAIGQLGPYSRTPVLYYTTSLLSQEGFRSDYLWNN